MIIGNPPFLGRKLLRDGLGGDYVEAMFGAYDGRVSAEADLVVYWFAKAWEAAVNSERPMRVGLVATNSIRGGANRTIIGAIAAANGVFSAWSDEAWTVDGAAVRVSLVCFGDAFIEKRLDGMAVQQINADLTSTASDLSLAKPLRENLRIAFMGGTKGGAFDISGETARQWLQLPLNPNARPNSGVLKPWANAFDIVRRRRDMWIIDFGTELSSSEAAFYEAPFRHLEEFVRAEREKNRREGYRKYWWRHMETRAGLRRAISNLQRFICTPKVSIGCSYGFI